MGQIEDKSQLINSSLTQRDPIQDHDRRIVEKLNRLNQASIVEARRRVAQMEATIANFEKTIRELEGWIQTEQSRPGAHADSTLATSLIQRRDTLKRSIEELKRKLAETQAYAVAMTAAMLGVASDDHAPA
jgi:predicted  nucleic acid-binding Zn-ribbon protein